MHLSIEDFRSSDLNKARLAHEAVITLDGKKVEFCIEADEEQGFVVCHKLNASGKYVLTASKTDIEKVVFHGVVKIIDPSLEN